MLKIDEIEEALKASGEYYDKPESAEDEVSAKDVMHVMGYLKGVDLPVLFDCIGMDTTMSYGAFLAAFPDREPPADTVIVDLEFWPDFRVETEVQLVHDTEPWIVLGLEFMFDHQVTISMAENCVTIDDRWVPFD